MHNSTKPQELTLIHQYMTFHIRPHATRGDQYEMNAAMADTTEISEGKVIKVRPSVLYPWLISRFVTGWEGAKDSTGAEVPWSLQALYDQPADPGEDLVLILGSYILNHTGLIANTERTERKKDLSPI